MIMEIAKPDFESRLAILRHKLGFLGLPLPSETVEFIASVVQENIRELEGVLNSVICQTELKKRDLSLTEVKQLIKNSVRPQKILSIKDVIKTVADFYNIEEKTLYEKTRRKEVVKPRQIVMYILREDLSTSYPHIGQKIKRDLKNNSLLGQEIDQIKTILYNEPQQVYMM